MILATLVLALMCVVGAAIALSARDLMRGVLGLALFFIGIAGFFGALGAWFLAAAQLFLFVGGVVTLFILAFNAAPPQVREHHSLRSTLLWSIIPVVLLFTFVLFLPTALPATTALPTAVSPTAAPDGPGDAGFVVSAEAPTGPAITNLAATLLGRYGWLIDVALLLLFTAVISANYLLEDDA